MNDLREVTIYRALLRLNSRWDSIVPTGGECYRGGGDRLASNIKIWIAITNTAKLNKRSGVRKRVEVVLKCNFISVLSSSGL